jgi:hypothetical protein
MLDGVSPRSPFHQKVGDFKIQDFIDIPGFSRIDLKHQWPLAQTVAARN